MTHTWTIPDLTLASFTGAVLDERWQGPTFEACGLRWRLDVVPNSRTDAEPEASAKFFVRLLDDTYAPVELAEVKLRVRGVADHEIKKRFFTGGAHDSEGPQSGTAWGFAKTHAFLATRTSLFLAGGQLVSSVTLRSRTFAELNPPTASAPKRADLIAAALPAPGAPLAEGVDVVFKAAGERIAAHSFLLALHSSVLRGALWGAAPTAASRRGAAASQPREVDVPSGITAATFCRVVAYMYLKDDDDKLPEDDQGQPLCLADVRDLLHAADLLDVPRLRESCAGELHRRLAPDNAAATLMLAERMSCAALKDAALRYIAANATAVMATPSWAELMQQPALLQAVVSTIATGEPPVKVAAT